MQVYSLHSIIYLLCTIFRYEHQNRSVATCTSDVFLEQKETEKQQTQHSEEMKNLQEAVAKLEEESRKNAKNLKEMEKKIEKNLELQNHIKTDFRKIQGIGILSLFVPFSGLNKLFYDAGKIQALKTDLTQLNSEKSKLQNKGWNIMVKLADIQLQLAISRIQLGERLSHDLVLQHLKDYKQNTFYKFIKSSFNSLKSIATLYCLSRCDSQSQPHGRRPAVSFSNPTKSGSASEALGESAYSAGLTERQDLC